MSVTAQGSGSALLWLWVVHYPSPSWAYQDPSEINNSIISIIQPLDKRQTTIELRPFGQLQGAGYDL